MPGIPLPARAADHVIGEGATRPVLQYTIKEDGSAVDLTNYTPTFSLRNEYGTAVTVDASMAIVTTASGIVSYTFTTTDTADHGRHYGQIKITSGASDVGVYPADGDTYVIIDVVPAIE